MFALSILTVGSVIEFIDQSAHLSAIAPAELGFNFSRYYSSEGYVQNRVESFDTLLFEREHTNTYYNFDSQDDSDSDDEAQYGSTSTLQLRSVYRFRVSSALNENEATTVERVINNLGQARFRDASCILQSPSIRANVQDALYQKVHNVWTAYYNRCSPVPPSLLNEIDLLFVSKSQFTALRWYHVDRLLGNAFDEDDSENKAFFVRACVEFVNYVYPEAAFEGDDSDHQWQRLLARLCRKHDRPWLCARAIVDQTFSGFSFIYDDVRSVLLNPQEWNDEQQSESREIGLNVHSPCVYVDNTVPFVEQQEQKQQEEEPSVEKEKENQIFQSNTVSYPLATFDHGDYYQRDLDLEEERNEWLRWCAGLAECPVDETTIDLPETDDWETYCPNSDYHEYQHWNHLQQKQKHSPFTVPTDEETCPLTWVDNELNKAPAIATTSVATTVEDDNCESCHESESCNEQQPNEEPCGNDEDALVLQFAEIKQAPKALVVQEFDMLHRVCAFTIVQRAAGAYGTPGEVQDALGRSLVECLTAALQYGDTAYLNNNTEPIVLDSWEETLLWPRAFTEQDMQLLNTHLQTFSYGTLRVGRCLSFLNERLCLNIDFVYRPSAFFSSPTSPFKGRCAVL